MTRLWKKRQFASQSGCCYLCGRAMFLKQVEVGDRGWLASVDHIWPLSRGGPHAPWNLALAHRNCNVEKDAMSLAEYIALRDARGLRVSTYARELLKLPAFAPMSSPGDLMTA